MDTMMEPWSRALDEFPLTGSPAARLRSVLRFAMLAPSSHNSQPWRFRIRKDVLELHADRSRALPVVDPDDRELVISCGAALHNVIMALRHYGCGSVMELLPGPPDLLATVRLHGVHQPTAEDDLLFDAMLRRHTSRLAFETRAVSAATLDALQEAAQQEGCWLARLDGTARNEAAELVAAADRLQMSSRLFRRELAAWMHGTGKSRRDGMPGSALGLNEIMSVAAPLVIRTFDLGAGRAAHSRDLALGSPLLAVLGTAGDTERDWLAAGLALEHVLLRAEAIGLRVSYLNQPIEVAEFRADLAALAGRGGFPQVLLRMGFGPAGAATPRRGVSEILDYPSPEPGGVTD